MVVQVKRVLPEGLSCEFRIVEISKSNARASQIQFADFARGDDLVCFVEYRKREVRYRSAKWRIPIEVFKISFGHAIGRANASAFGWTIDVDKLRASMKAIEELLELRLGISFP